MRYETKGKRRELRETMRPTRSIARSALSIAWPSQPIARSAGTVTRPGRSPIKHSVTGGTPGTGDRKTESVSGRTYFLKDGTSGSEEVRMFAVTFRQNRDL